MTHRILLVLLSCTALGWAGPAMADDEGSGGDYGYDSAAEGAYQAQEAMDNPQYQTVMPDGSIIYGSRNDAAAADNGSADVAGDQSYYDYGGAAAVGDGSADYWTGTGETTTDVGAVAGDQSYYDYGDIGLTGTGLGFDAMSGFSMQNMTKFFNPAKPGGCTLTGPMMGKIMGNFPMVEKFLGAQDKCNQQQVTKTMMAEQKSFGQYLARQQNQQLIFSKNSQMAERAAPGILAGMGGGGGGASGGGGLFEGIVGVGGIDVALSGMANQMGLGDAMNTFNSVTGTANNVMNFANGALGGTTMSTVVNAAGALDFTSATSAPSVTYTPFGGSPVVSVWNAEAAAAGGANTNPDYTFSGMDVPAPATTASSMFTFPPGEGASTVVTKTYVPGSFAPVTGWGSIPADN